ncbi:hypothetical protein RHSIM_Rhsim04G0088400 [Rhododendron simsii]|uniref:phosphoribosylglycinamide formyltransferase 1 n=1 Tax=Rhododendron simsii TaxID=118357 RepID=A0A834H1K5_RHOSS|nr:hypothetical protein RHSIM_Rhsim04G0088400 [Rhododendron simsii]
MEARCFISGFGSNPIINNPIQNPSKASFPAIPSYSNRVFFKTLYSLSWKLDSREHKLQCRSSLQKVEAVSGDTEGLKSGDRKKNLAVFVSSGGSNFRSIHEAIVEGSIEGEIIVLVTNKPGCGGAEYARDNNIPVILFPGMKEQPDGLSANDLVSTLRNSSQLLDPSGHRLPQIANAVTKGARLRRAQARSGQKPRNPKDDGLTPEQRLVRDAKALQENLARKGAQGATVGNNKNSSDVVNKNNKK